MNTDNMVWVEKYRPSTIDECILPDRIKNIAKSSVSKGEMPNLLLCGPAGTGKTTLARALCNELGYDMLFINGSDEGRLIDTLRTKISQFASTVSFSGSRKAVIIDEADYLPQETVQPALRSFIEQYAGNCAFIFTCNFPNRIMDAIHSRCSVIDFTLSKEEKMSVSSLMFKSCVNILSQEGIDFDKKALAKFVMMATPDWRRMLNDMQSYSSTGKIDSGILTSRGGIEIEELIGLLKDKNFREVRTWVATSSSLDMTILCRKIYDGMYDYVEKSSIPQLVLDLADYQFKHAFVADKEINIMAMLTTLMMNAEFK